MLFEDALRMVRNDEKLVMCPEEGLKYKKLFMFGLCGDAVREFESCLVDRFAEDRLIANRNFGEPITSRRDFPRWAADEDTCLFEPWVVFSLDTGERIPEGVIPSLRHNAEWSNDCCGKKDFDGTAVSISTRYWPAGGSALVLDTESCDAGLKKLNDGSRSSAKASLILDTESNPYGFLTLVESDYIEGDSFYEVQRKVEDWVQNEFDKLVNILSRHYVIKKP